MIGSPVRIIPRSDPPPPRLLFLLSLIVIALLPLPGLFTSLRADDIWTLRTASLPLSEMLATIAGDVHPPLYFLLFWPWLRLFGDTEVAMRAFSLLLHWLAVAAVYRCATRALPRQTAWLAAIAYACAPLALLSTELVRMYSLLGLLSALSITAFQDVAEHPSPRRVALWTLINVAGSFTHLWWFCLLAGQALAALVCHPRLWRLWSAGLIASTLPYSLLWGPVLLRQLNRSTDAAAWLLPPGAGDILPLLYLQAGVLLVLAPLAWLWTRRRPAAFTLPLWLPVLLAGALLPPILISFWKPFFYSRFTIVILPATACWLAALAARLSVPVIATVVLSLSSLVTLSLSFQSTPCDTRALASSLLQHSRPDDSILYVSLSRPAIDFYLDRERPQHRWRESSFPSAIDTHPGFEGDSRSQSLLPAWRNEAASLAREIAQRPGARVFVFLRNDHQPSAILEQALAAALQPVPALDCHCPARSNYIDRLAVFEAPHNVPATALH
jgi:mannosyltransferase